MVRCVKCIVNNETRWHIQINSAKISLLTEAFHTDAFLVIYGEYSTDFYFDPPTQSSLNKCLQEDHLLAVSVSPKY